MKQALLVVLLASLALGAELKVRVSWGHQSVKPTAFHIRLAPLTQGVEVRDASPDSLEGGESFTAGAWETRAGAGDVDGVRFSLVYPDEPEKRLQNLHVIWADLIAQSDSDTAHRLGADAAFRTNASKLAVLMNPEGTRGFAVSADQLRDNQALWIPSLDVFLTAGDRPVSFEEHQKSLAAWKGRRILDQVRASPEATRSEFTSRWEDMGNPSYTHPQQRGPGHIVCLTWDSAIPKFGIDRGAGVWNDYGNPDRFHFWFGFADIAEGITRSWKSQSLERGLPLIQTVLEKEGIPYTVEQFAYPLEGPPAERRGDIAMLLLQKVRVANPTGSARTVPLSMTCQRQFPPYQSATVAVERSPRGFLFRESAHQRILFAVEGAGDDAQWHGTRDYQRELTRIDATIFLDLPANGSKEFIVKLPSPAVAPQLAGKLAAIDYAVAREATLRFWGEHLARGAQFRVPEQAVNDLFRANLWHALRLPRRHGGASQGVAIDLPYSNFAYSQTGTPWPVNQAVYVDYMLYDLRGHHQISLEELLTQFRNNQEQNGHVNGVANWLVYTPGMLYAVAQNYLLSRDRAALDRLLPYSLKSLDWCLREVRSAKGNSGPSRGLVAGPLNDGTGEGVWAFNQAYLYAGLQLFGKVLAEIRHPLARETQQAAHSLSEAISRGFGAASARSPLVQLRDHTWSPYVPCEVLTPRRILEQWYATDVDTGPVHLLRLKGLSPDGELADALLNDHEDNLYLKGWGIANEPVYNQQGTAYLLRDDPKAAIRTFYSYMASAFSHAALEPVEHRWTHGQYFGPPSTDGAWFELYRNMLVREVDDGTLLVAQAAPRKWFEDGSEIEVTRAPTWFGPVSLRIESHARSGRIAATIDLSGQHRPESLLVRLRHPEGKVIQSVTVGGKPYHDFDARKEWVRIAAPAAAKYSIVASY